MSSYDGRYPVCREKLLSDYSVSNQLFLHCTIQVQLCAVQKPYAMMVITAVYVGGDIVSSDESDSDGFVKDGQYKMMVITIMVTTMVMMTVMVLLRMLSNDQQ